ncbi:uncharacterized protein LOC119672771 [Teleopsis dalmanni]|uniref:uncharacterized protein LOC119672771 n=1 Tax=Teleopsis dalmanni TaxID=139649 RepID=UPI0018CDC39A|nr:uncharacterized protein LOC119672771 [Teleopsis dalmanni]XP_037939832.1 uncharacterized protein LOC119672771 [Teleopsis dalmanni]
MVGREITPTEIGKHSKLIKAAQEEMSTMDVLVCGRCLNVFHFADEFKAHKQKSCSKDTNNVRDTNDTKPKIWAFLLWKSTQLNKETYSNPPNSWSLYQTWVKMEENIRETWIVAGKTIQSFSKVGQGSLHEMPVKITKTVVNNTDSSPGRKPLNQTKPQVTNIKPPAKVGANAKGHDSDSESSPAKSSSLVPTPRIIKKPAIGNASQVQSKLISGANQTKTLSRSAKRTVPNPDDIVEENVEKIVAKRFNPRRKCHEYLVKWEGRTHEHNTWEPLTHLENVPHLLDTFEKQLARQKESRAAMQAKQQASLKESVGAAKNLNSNQNSIEKSNVSTQGVDSSGRPIRSSKQRAMDQVKQWVQSTESASDINDTNSTTQDLASIKRKLDDSDFNDSNASDLPATTATMEDLEEDLIPSHTVKRMRNGNSVSVEVKTKTEKSLESKVIKVNGSSVPSTENSESTAFSAEVIITQDLSSSGVVKKPGFNGPSNTGKTEAQIRILSKGESTQANSGIIRINNSQDSATPVRQIRVGTSAAGQTVTTSTIGSTQITTINQRPIAQRTPGATIIQRKGVTSAAIQPTPRTGAHQQISPSSGRMIIPRQSTVAQRPNTVTSKNVTPEQKILQLSKSGDLKVTKKVMTREDAVAQRMTPQQRQQHLRQQQQQSGVQIQKVQQISAPNSRGAATRKQSESYAQEEHQAQLCPITGNLIGQEDQTIVSQTQKLQSGVMQTQLVSEQQQLQEQMGDIESALLTGEQQMLTNEDGSPLLVTGEDGTVYQVAGKNAEGQTILVTQGPDGEQQFAYVAASDGDENQVLNMENAVGETVVQLPSEHDVEALAAAGGENQYIVKTLQEDGSTQVVTMTAAELAQHSALTGNATEQLTVQTNDEAQDGNIPAEVVQAELPSPGGTRRVVLLLQDGTFMMTEMHDDEFKALNLNA